ncbi:MAG: subtilisin-like serine protease [Chlorobi bacterium OLB5]|nr:MAG: subtilisin-like serine protease [Chlorobi bacterium OLB5]
MLTAFLSLSFLSFKSSENKIGNMLSKALDNPSGGNYIVWVYFKDKGPNAMSKLNDPLSIVSQRSLDRRLKVKPAGQLLDFTDVPLYSNYVNSVAANVVKVRHQIKWLNCMSVEANREQITAVANYDFVKGIELVERFVIKNEDNEISSDVSPVFINPNDDPLADTLSYGTGNAVTQITQIKVNLVHNQGIRGQGIMIASFDAGFSNLTHEAFTTYPMKIQSTYDFQNNTPTLTGHSHGTATLCLVGGYKPGKMVGPAYGSTFILGRTEVDPTERPVEMDNWIRAALWADSLGADIITSSLGYLDFDPGYTSYTWQDMNGNTLPITIAADLAVNKGILVSNSAGNDGSSTHNTLGGPADGDSVLTVGSVTSSGVRSSFSSVGPTTDNPPRIKPDVMAMGSSNYYASTTGNNYSSGSGTSFSCPLTSGVCALVLSANKNLTPLQVMGILKKFASNSSSPNNQMGWGIIDASLAVDSARKLDNWTPVIQHTQPFTMTSLSTDITMKAKITDNGIIRNWTNEAPLLYYRKSTNGGTTWSAFTAANYTAANLDTFSFVIPGSAIGTTVQYYFAAQDIALPTPKMVTLPDGGSGVTPPGSTAPPTRFQYVVAMVGIQPVSNEIPGEFKLYTNYPNPFNPITKIKFDIAKNTNAKLLVYDVLGRVVETLISGDIKAGRYEIDFDGYSLASGVYFYKLVTNEFVETRRMLLVK